MLDSCYTCRRRRIECEMSRPPCRKCEKAGLECFEKRPLRWVAGAAFRNKRRDSSTHDGLVVPTAAARLGSSMPRRDMVVKPADRSRLIVASNTEIHGPLDHPSPTIPLTPDDPFLSSSDRATRYYLCYYSTYLCKQFILYDSSRNPLRNLIPAALDSPALSRSIVALSARHMANTGQSFYQPGTAAFPGSMDVQHNALLFKHRAIQALSRALDDPSLHRQGATVASAFLLIFLDLLESGNSGWRTHVEGVQRLMTQIHPGPQHDLGETIGEIRDFITAQIYLIATLGATHTHPRLLSSPAFLQQSRTPLLKRVDQLYLGCPEYLLDALQSFITCRNEVTNLLPLDDIALRALAACIALRPYIQQTCAVLDSTQNFDCHSWALHLPQPDHSAAYNPQILYTLAQSYKLGTLIYGRRVHDALTGNISYLDDLVCELVDTISALRSDGTLFKCILWPMFIAGLESRQKSQRHFLIGCLEKFWLETKCLNVVNAGDILRRFWDQKDHGSVSSPQWIFNTSQLGHEWLLI